MTSNIDPTTPVQGTPALKSDMRANWQAAHDEIEALQAALPILVSSYGATEGADITTAVQAAINAAAASDPARDVLIDIHRGTISDTIQVGDGSEFRTLRVRGFGMPYTDSNNHSGTALTCTVTDRPAFAINGGRYSTISDMLLEGPAYDGIIAFSLTGTTITSDATWDAALTSAGVTPGKRYAPHAAIAIDAYIGTEPAVPYPGGLYTGLQRSHLTIIERVKVQGWEVGVVQTPADEGNNGDFPQCIGCSFDANKIAFSVGNDQSRIPIFDRCQFARIQDVFVNSVHGVQLGQGAARFYNCGFGAYIGRLFKLKGSSRGTPAFYGCDVESLHRIGDFDTGGSNEVTTWFDNCDINFRHSVANGIPTNVIDGNAFNGVVGFRGGSIRFYSPTDMVSGGPELVFANDCSLTFVSGDTSRRAPNYVGEGEWDQGALRLGGYYLWVDSTGDLRIKSGAPTSDTDGAVVGTQS